MMLTCHRCGTKRAVVDSLHEICTDCVITSAKRDQLNTLERLTRQLDSRLSWCQVVGDKDGEKKVVSEIAELFRAIEELQKHFTLPRKGVDNVVA